jgi:hypothetical protein
MTIDELLARLDQVRLSGSGRRDAPRTTTGTPRCRSVSARKVASCSIVTRERAAPPSRSALPSASACPT